MLLAAISDLHLTAGGAPAFGTIDTRARAERALAAVARLAPRPDALLVAGDLADDGSDDAYAGFREIAGPLGIPVYVVPGNHDAREPMRRAFLADGYLPDTGFLNYRIDLGPHCLIGLDTLEEGASYGTFCAERQAWLDAALAASAGRPVLVMLHHPPFATGMNLDAIGCRDGSAIETILARHGHVEMVLAGHVHRPMHRRWAGTLASICPSVAPQFALDLGRPRGYGVVLEAPQIQLLHWQDGAGPAVHLAPVDEPAVLYDRP